MALTSGVIEVEAALEATEVVETALLETGVVEAALEPTEVVEAALEATEVVETALSETGVVSMLEVDLPTVTSDSKAGDTGVVSVSGQNVV